MIFVTVGTDHHPFDRLLGWVERWALDAGGDAEVVVQHGPGLAPAATTARPFLGYAEMQELFERADAVVCAGGPGTIMSARSAGCRPIVVPRLGSLDEAVDDHQRAFADLLADQGLAVVVHDEAGLRAALDAVRHDPDRYRFDPADAEPPAGVGRVGDLIDDLLERRRRDRPQRLRRFVAARRRRSGGSRPTPLG